MKDKLIAGGLIFATLMFFYFRVSSQPVRSANWFAEVTAQESERIFTDLGGKLGQKPIVVFETAWCSVCKAVRASMDKKLIPHIAVNIEDNEKARLHYMSLLAGRQGGVPLSLIGTKAVMGYRWANIEKAFKDLEQTHFSGSARVLPVGNSK